MKMRNKPRFSVLLDFQNYHLRAWHKLWQSTPPLAGKVAVRCGAVRCTLISDTVWCGAFLCVRKKSWCGAARCAVNPGSHGLSRRSSSVHGEVQRTLWRNRTESWLPKRCTVCGKGVSYVWFYGFVRIQVWRRDEESTTRPAKQRSRG